MSSSQDDTSGPLEPMSMSTETTGPHESFLSNGFFSTHSFSLSYIKEMLIERGQAGFLPIAFTGFLLMILIVVTILQSGNDFGSGSISYDISNRPQHLRDLIAVRTAEASSFGTIVTTPLKSSSTIKDGSISFIISIAGSAPSSSSPNLRPSDDPLSVAAVPPSLIVSTIPPVYTLILNKYNTIKDHTLLVTNEYEEQSSRLTIADIETWHWCLSQIDATGMFNSGPKAGASQKHKHMQIVPNDSLQELRENAGSYLERVEDFFFENKKLPFPVDDYVQRKIQDNVWYAFPLSGKDNKIFHTIEGFDFPHSVVVLQHQNVNSSAYIVDTEYATYLHAVYLDLLSSVGVPCALKGLYAGKDCKEYNLIFTLDWMMIVTRATASWDGGQSTVNSFPYMGLLLAKDTNKAEEIKKRGVRQILKDVAEATEAS